MKTIIEQALKCAGSETENMPVESLASSTDMSQYVRGVYLTQALHAEFPSRFFYALYIAGELEQLFPEIYQMTKMSQPVRWHPEGNVFNHTMQVMHVLERLVEREWKRDAKWPKLISAALFHDIGKIVSKRPPAHPNHEKKGVDEYNKLVEKYGLPVEWGDEIRYVIEYHGHVHKAKELKPTTVKKVFDAAPSGDARLMLLNVSYADSMGRSQFNATINPLPSDMFGQFFTVLENNNSDLKTLKNFMSDVQ